MTSRSSDWSLLSVDGPAATLIVTAGMLIFALALFLTLRMCSLGAFALFVALMVIPLECVAAAGFGIEMIALSPGRFEGFFFIDCDDRCLPAAFIEEPMALAY